MRVEQLRGAVVEAWHDVHVAVVDGAGALVAGTGDPELVTFWRSAAKPFQALPLVERSEEHTSELQSPCNLVCRLLLEKKKRQLQRQPAPASAAQPRMPRYS